ncbi:MAG: hypothetical protein ACREX3_05675, partial [Gammaproteobacteria bacterium]
FAECGIHLSEANIDRRHGLNNLRHELAWRGRGPNGTDALPRLTFMRTEGNLWLFDQLETIVCDPGDPEDVLKQNANPDTGEGGDDGYDCLRYAIASRPMRAGPPRDDEPLTWQEMLKLEYERTHRSKPRWPPSQRNIEFGVD